MGTWFSFFTDRWSRFLDTNDLKGVKAQGEVWRREAVKTVRPGAQPWIPRSSLMNKTDTVQV